MEQLRLFIALNLPEKLKRTLNTFIEELRKLPSDAKWVESENLHLTVQFLGRVDGDRVPAVTGALGRAAQGISPFRLEFSGVGLFPSEQRPRVIWVGVSGETAVLSRLHRRVQQEMGRVGFKPEKRRFSPHLTLARMRSPAGFPALMTVAEKLARERGGFGGAKISSVDLMLSELGSRGPRYSVLARIALPGFPV